MLHDEEHLPNGAGALLRIASERGGCGSALAEASGERKRVQELEQDYGPFRLACSIGTF